MILAEKGKNIVELISYEHYRCDELIREKYFTWLENLQVTNLISSPDLLLPKKKDFIDQSFDRFIQKTAVGFFIRYKPDDVIVGTIKLDQISFFKRNAMDGIMIGEPIYYGKGIACQAYRIVLEYAFNILGLERIYGGCNERNIGMIKVYERLGYAKEGILRKNDYINGEYTDHFLYGILKEEFSRKHQIELVYQ